MRLAVSSMPRTAKLVDEMRDQWDVGGGVYTPVHFHENAERDVFSKPPCYAFLWHCHRAQNRHVHARWHNASRRGPPGMWKGGRVLQAVRACVYTQMAGELN